jgi:hypothetical protein
MNKQFLDVVERTAATFVLGFLSIFSFSNLGTAHDALIAGAAGAATVVYKTLQNFLSK